MTSVVLVALLLHGCVNSTPPRSTEDVAVPAEDLGTFECAAGPGELFERRVRPLLDAERGSSCSKCHAPGVDLAAFVTGDPCSSMTCLVDQGMVDLDDPESSRILQLIVRGFDPGAESTPADELAAAEYQGFLEWIEWSSMCRAWCVAPEGSLDCGLPDTPLLEQTPVPDPLDLEHYPCGDDEQARAFRDHVFPSQARCGHCHAVNGTLAGVADASKWLDHRRTIDGSKRSIQRLYALGAIELDYPPKSMVLLKPLHENVGGVEHGGGGKFTTHEDPLYVALLQWLEMQAECRVASGTPTAEWIGNKAREKYENLPYPH